jgi:hypothetical protein
MTELSCWLAIARQICECPVQAESSTWLTDTTKPLNGVSGNCGLDCSSAIFLPLSMVQRFLPIGAAVVARMRLNITRRETQSNGVSGTLGSTEESVGSLASASFRLPLGRFFTLL